MNAVPDVVWRGLGALSRDNDGVWIVHHGSERDLRDALAALWWLHGADVSVEVPVPNCGRIDLRVDLPGERPQIWEVKRSLLTVSAARRAFQQAHTYERYCDAAGLPGLWVTTFVTAADWSVEAVAPAEDSFNTVRGVPFGMALAYPERLGNREVACARSELVADLLHHLRSSVIDLATWSENARLGDAA